MSDGDDYFAERIKSEITARNWSQSEFTHRLNLAGVKIHQSALSKLFSPPPGEGRRRTTVNELIAMSAILGISIDELVGVKPNSALDQKRSRIRELLSELIRLI